MFTQLFPEIELNMPQDFSNMEKGEILAFRNCEVNNRFFKKRAISNFLKSLRNFDKQNYEIGPE